MGMGGEAPGPVMGCRPKRHMVVLSGWKLGLARAGLVVGSLLLPALAFEGVARVMGLAPPGHPHTEGPECTRLCSDPVLRFENNAGVHVREVYPQDDGSERVAEISIDERGLRGWSATPEKPAGMFRIACLGDSQTFGEGCSDDETWPAHLQERLDPGRDRIEVINFGVNAYDTEQEVRLLETRALAYDPDLVLLAYFVNDAAVRSTAHKGKPLDFGKPSKLHDFLTSDGWFHSLRQVSCLVDWWADRVERHESLEYFGSSRGVLYADDAAGWLACRRELRRAQALLRKSNLPFVVVLYPYMFRSGDNLGSHDSYATVKTFLDRSKIRYVDVEDAYAGMDVERFQVHPRDVHTNGAGNRIAADAIGTFLVQDGLVP